MKSSIQAINNDPVMDSNVAIKPSNLSETVCNSDQHVNKINWKESHTKSNSYYNPARRTHTGDPHPTKTEITPIENPKKSTNS